MKYDPKKHNRRSIRLKGYDYTQPGGYFITMVTFQRECLFGDISDGKMKLSTWGHMADECWRAIPDHFPHVDLGTYVIMPNHVHGIIIIHGRDTKFRVPTIEQFGKPVPGSIPTIIRTYKAAVTRHIGREFDASHLWQRNYFEHVIRHDNDYQRIHDYILNNPAKWSEDSENPLMSQY